MNKLTWNTKYWISTPSASTLTSLGSMNGGKLAATDFVAVVVAATTASLTAAAVFSMLVNLLALFTMLRPIWFEFDSLCWPAAATEEQPLVIGGGVGGKTPSIWWWWLWWLLATCGDDCCWWWIDLVFVADDVTTALLLLRLGVVLSPTKRLWSVDKKAKTKLMWLGSYALCNGKGLNFLIVQDYMRVTFRNGS